jgi:hypothetical protein
MIVLSKFYMQMYPRERTLFSVHFNRFDETILEHSQISRPWSRASDFYLKSLCTYSTVLHLQRSIRELLYSTYSLSSLFGAIRVFSAYFESPERTT